MGVEATLPAMTLARRVIQTKLAEETQPLKEERALIEAVSMF